MTSPLEPRVVVLQKSHERANFDCGEEALNLYLQRYARQNAEAGIGLTYVAVLEERAAHILGYYTVSSSRIARDLVPPQIKLPPHPVPTLLLARLAVDRRAHGTGLGAFLLRDLVKRALVLASEVGLWGIEVDASHQKASEFYLRFGFAPLQDSPLHLFLPLITARETLLNS